jgi:hypothetical protein
MRKPFGFGLILARVILSCSFAIAWSGLAMAQGPPPLDKHVGGDVTFDETVAEAEARRKSRHIPVSEDRVIKSGVLAPSKEDRATFAAFLHLHDTGLIRLLPPGSVAYRRGSPIIPGDGSYYSFANVSHYLDYGTDVELNRSQLLIPDMGFGYGFMTNLGAVPIEEIDLSSSAASFMVSYKPAVTLLAARAEALGFRHIVTTNGVLYQAALPVEVGSTFLLRSITYKERIFGAKELRGAVNSPRATDVLVALRIIRKDADASVIIAWKLLTKSSSPSLE